MRALRLLVLAAALCSSGAGCGAAAPTASTTPAGRGLAARSSAEAPGDVPDPGDDAQPSSEPAIPRRGAGASPVPAPPVVRIGSGRRCDDAGDVAITVEPGAEGDAVALVDPPAPRDEAHGAEASRPVLRLYGPERPASIGAVAPLPGPEAPSVVPPPPQVAGFGRLPVVPEGAVPAIPEQPLTIAPDTRASGDDPRADDPVVREYQAALADVEARRWEQALVSLDRFARAHAEHPYADNAIYWQGEVLYALREYRRALGVLEALVARYPSGNKVPDALLRIGFCLQRLGDLDRARATFRRVREQYPDSVAARMASREET